jgi:hypothetical protein
LIAGGVVALGMAFPAASQAATSRAATSPAAASLPAASQAAATLAAAQSWSPLILAGGVAGTISLASVSCWAPHDCVAVGHSVVGNGDPGPVVDMSIQGTWKVQQIELPGNPHPPYWMTGVSCASKSYCVAVGNDYSSSIQRLAHEQAFSEVWNGAGWQDQLLPNDIGEVTAVSCSGPTTCTAVGEDHLAHPMVAVLSEGRWSSSHLPGGAGAAEPSAISCTHKDFCVAVGSESAGKPVAYAGFGRRWSHKSLPSSLAGAASGVRLTGVRCTGPGWCMVTGYRSVPHTSDHELFVAKWSGSAWSITILQSGRLTEQAAAVDCLGTTSCDVVATRGGRDDPQFGPSGYAAEAYHFDGSTWTPVTVAGLPTGGAIGLRSVACSGGAITGSCISVGIGAPPLQLAISVTGVPTAGDVTPGLLARQNALGGVACAAEGVCFGVGQVFTNLTSGASAPLVEQMGTGYATVRTMTGSFEPFTTLTGVACASARLCFAVGTEAPSGALGSKQTALVAEWTGGATWKQLSLPSAKGTGLQAVACGGPSSCLAVGYGRKRGVGFMHPAAYHWNGSRWSATQPPEPNGDAYLNGATCTSATSCIAVGGSMGVDITTTLVESWHAGTWKQQSSQSIGGIGFSQLYGVACRTAHSCLAVGSGSALGGKSYGIVEQLSGRTWRIAHKQVSAVFDAVACPSATSCTVFGNAPRGHHAALPTAEGWNGSRWSAISLRPPLGDRAGYVKGVACSTSTSCIAVGWGSSKHSGTWAVGYRYG